jgi:hypothetical protein
MKRSHFRPGSGALTGVDSITESYLAGHGKRRLDTGPIPASLRPHPVTGKHSSRRCAAHAKRTLAPTPKVSWSGQNGGGCTCSASRSKEARSPTGRTRMRDMTKLFNSDDAGTSAAIAPSSVLVTTGSTSSSRSAVQSGSDQAPSGCPGAIALGRLVARPGRAAAHRRGRSCGPVSKVLRCRRSPGRR